jgi:uncharacterized protein YjbI with pentapeptide repeats
MLDGISLIGDGVNVTFIRGTANYRIRIEAISNASIRNLTMDGSGYVGVFVNDTAISTLDMENFVFEDLFIDKSNEDGTNMQHGIGIKKLYSGSDFIRNININRVRIYGAGGLNGGSGHDNIYVASYSQGSNTGGVEDVNIANCHLEVAGRQNISIAGDGVYIPTRVNISNCTLIDSSLAGVDLEEGSDATITNCNFIRSGDYQGYFAQTSFSAMNAGISHHGGDTTVSVSDCSFHDCHYGIAAHGGCVGDVSNTSFLIVWCITVRLLALVLISFQTVDLSLMVH